MEVLLAGIAAFAATNIDDLLLLTLLFAGRSVSRPAIVLGQFGGIAILFGVSVLAATLALALPLALVAGLGLIPILLGIRMLRSSDRPTGESAPPRVMGLAGVAATTVANGADNIGVYVPLFAIYPGSTLAVWALVFIVMTLLWCAVAVLMVSQPHLRATIDRFGRRALPWGLIAIGAWIVSRAWV